MVDFTKRSKKANCLTIRYQKELSKLWTIESYKKRRLHRGQQLRQPDIELKSRGSRSHTQVGITLLSRFWWAAASGFAEELARGSFVMMGVNSVIHPSLPFCTTIGFPLERVRSLPAMGWVNLAKAAKKRQKAPAGSCSAVHGPEMARAVTWSKRVWEQPGAQQRTAFTRRIWQLCLPYARL